MEIRQNIWSQAYIDAMVFQAYRPPSSASASETRVYAMQDANFNVTSTVARSASGEWKTYLRFYYTPYGTVIAAMDLVANGQVRQAAGGWGRVCETPARSHQQPVSKRFSLAVDEVPCTHDGLLPWLWLSEASTTATRLLPPPAEPGDNGAAGARRLTASPAHPYGD